ncbi:MAG: 5'/3'-nucleotidase SurE [Synergistaceae bacterium]|jgi:5'-nucleotidase|nr:5'/3'-nucleotidase SurE [Synergistaceae bacterium]
MKILLTNDDGVISQGIQMMSKLLADKGWLEAVVAPDRERSGTGHSITVGHPVRVHPLDPGMYPAGISAYSCDGTPTDCVNIGLDLFFPHADFVVSGINQGPNLGDDVTYSGTVCAALEGVILGRPAVAVSLCMKPGDTVAHNMTAAITAIGVLDYVQNSGLPEGVLLNVNVPNVLIKNIKGFMLTSRGKRNYRDKFTCVKDPRGKDCYWISGDIVDEHGEGTDVTAVSEGYVSVTPVYMDMTNYSLLYDMRVSGVEEALGGALKINPKQGASSN